MPLALCVALFFTKNNNTPSLVIGPIKRYINGTTHKNEINDCCRGLEELRKITNIENDLENNVSSIFNQEEAVHISRFYSILYEKLGFDVLREISKFSLRQIALILKMEGICLNDNFESFPYINL